MPDDPNGTGSATLNDPTTTPGVTPTTPPSTGATPGDTTTTLALSAEDLQAQVQRMTEALKKANAEAKEHRLAANKLKELQDAIEAEKLTETEKLQKQLATLQREREEAVLAAQEERIAHAVSLQASKLNFNDPDDARRFIDNSGIEYDASGRPNNVAELLAEVLRVKPYLAAQPGTPRQTPPTVGATNPSRQQTSGLNEINRDNVSKIMAGGKTAWAELSPDEQSRISAFIQRGGMLRR
jgi:hypothetical protein